MSERTKEIRETLMKARDTPHYNVGSPAALDHLLTHIVALIQEIERLEQEQSDAWQRHHSNHATSNR